MDVWYDGSHAMSFYQYGTSDDPVDTLIGHTWRDWGLIPSARPLVTPPSPKTSTIEINGADGVIDASESLTKWPLYNNRTGQWTFYVTDYNDHSGIVLDNSNVHVLDDINDPIRDTVLSNWQGMYTRLLNAIHGKMLVVVLDDDPDYFYKGKFKIDQWVSSNDGSLSGVTISYDVFPYKFKKNKTGIWISDENPTIEIKGGRQPLIPYIYTRRKNDETTGNIQLEFINQELGIHHTGITYGNHIQKYIRMEDLGENHNADCIVTNLSGNNVCTLTVTNIANCEFVYIQFREGDL